MKFTTRGESAALCATEKKKGGLRAQLKEKKDKKKESEEEEIKDPREPDIKHTLYIFRYLHVEFILVLLGLTGAAVSGAIPIALYEVIGSLIDGLTPSTTAVSTSRTVIGASAILQVAKFKATVNNSAVWVAILAAIAFGAAFVENFFMNWAHDRFGVRLRKAYFNSLLNQEIGYFDMKKTGQLVSELADTSLIQMAYSTKLGEIVRNLVQAILGVALGIVAGWKMALVMLSVAPLMVFVLGGTGVFTKAVVTRITDIINKAAGIANEVISAMRTVRSMDGEEKEKIRYARQLRKAHGWFVVKASILGIAIGIISFVIWGAIALGFWYGGKMTLQGEMTIGDMFKVFGLNLMAVIGLLMGMQAAPEFSKADPALKNMLKVIRREPAMRHEGGEAPNKLEGHIEFKNVFFTYPTRPGVVVLKDFSLTIKPGQSVALVGASGSGKSTIVGLIEKFYQADSGEITLDGVSLERIDPRWLHRNIGIVTQEPTLFAGSIKQNICYAIEGLREVTDEEIQRAAVAANAHDFIMDLTDGYETMLGEKGVSLSGGQKQRVAIARAMIQNPTLLLLDEATSALDTQSEGVVQDALTKLMQGRTSIVIAHRLSTIVDSDKICVMHKGELKEQGTHHELLRITDGYYSRLANKQMMMGRAAAAAISGTGNSTQSSQQPTSSDSEEHTDSD